MFVSFIVPVYNAENYIRPCLDSLLAQDISDYEIVCINDGSKDDSPRILDEYAANYPHVTVIHKKNGGVTTARNTGVEAARGDYIWFVDSDDLVKANVLGMLRAKADETRCDRLIVGGYQFTDAMSEEEWVLSQTGQLPINTSWYDAVVWRNLLRRDFLQEHKLSFRYPDITHGEDGLYMYEVGIANPSAAEIEEALYFYRVHSGSAETVVSAANLKKKLHSYTRVTQVLLDYYNRGQKNAATANKLMTFLWFALHCVASLPRSESRAALQKLKEAKLYPFRRLPECSLTCSYMTDRTGLIGKVYDKLYLNLHTPWGFAGMRLLQQLLRMKRSLSK